MVRSDDGLTGFFTSNRRGNDDIYGFTFKDYRVLLKGKMTDNITKEPLPNTQLNLINNGIKTSFYTDGSGVFEKELPKDAKLLLEVEKPGYALFSKQLNTETIDDDTILTTNISLTSLKQILPPITIPNDCDRIKALVAEFKIYYDLDKAAIRADAKETMED